MHRPLEPAQPGHEPPRRRDLTGVKFRIAAGQPDHIRRRVGWLIGQWRKRQNLGPRRPPTRQKMRIKERKRLIPGQGDPLSRWRDPGPDARHPPRRRRHHRRQIDVASDKIGKPVQRRVQPCRLSGLHQPQMPFGQADAGVFGQRAEHFDARAFHPIAHQRFMPGAGNPVQNHPRHPAIDPVPAETHRNRRRRLCLPADIQHQHHRPAHPCCDISRRPNATGPGHRHPVKQPHRPFGNRQPVARRQPVEHRPRHRPTVEVETGPLCRSCVKPRVDIVRPAFIGPHRHAILRQRPQQPQRHRGLAGTRTRGRYDQTRAHSGNLTDPGRKRRS